MYASQPFGLWNGTYVRNASAATMGTWAGLNKRDPRLERASPIPRRWVANYTLHSAVMTGLRCDAQHFYRVGCDGEVGWLGDDNVRGREPCVQGNAMWPQCAAGYPALSSAFHALCDEGWAGREPVWAMFGDLGLTVDEFRDLAPSIPALINDLQALAAGGAVI